MNRQEIMKKVFREIDNLPPIPDNIVKIKNLISDPKSSIESIAQYVKRDPALSADLLRISNSVRYISRTRVISIERAITVIGLKPLESIVLSIAAKEILDDRYAAMEEIWKHSHKCAFFAQYLMKMKKIHGEVESAYTAGLLHDIGKLVLLSLHPALVQRITKLSETKNVPIEQVEKLAIGLNHAQIGEEIAVKWNFHDKLSSAIGCHHAPKLIKPEWTPLGYTVYLANILSKLNEIPTELINQIEPKVLEFFEIDSEKSLKTIVVTLKGFYESLGQN